MANTTTEALTKKTDGAAAAAERTKSGMVFRPNVDIVESADELLLLADMPGVQGDQIDIHFEDGELSIHGPVTQRQDESQQFLLREYGVGDFQRTFRVSEQIDSTRIHAEYADGVLKLHLPKVERVKPRKIAVNTP